jgi:hypothetical protein
MMIKVVTLFLIFILAMGIFGKLRLPWRGGRTGRIARPGKCRRCGRFLIGGKPCDCDRRA